MVHFLVWSNFRNISIHLGLDTLELFFCLILALFDRIIIMVKETRISPLFLSEFLNASTHNMPDMASVLWFV